MSLIIRPARANESVFVESSWVKSYDKSWYAGPLPMHRSYAAYSATVAELRQRSRVQTDVAVSSEADDVVLGFCVWEPPGYHQHTRERLKDEAGPRTVLYTCQRPMLLYVYVVEGSRRDGVAGALLQAAGIDPHDPFCFVFNNQTMKDLVRGYERKPRRAGERPEFVRARWPGGRWNPQTYRFRTSEEGANP